MEKLLPMMAGSLGVRAALQLSFLGLVGASLLVTTGCGKKDDPDDFSGCLAGYVEKDQYESFMRRMRPLPNTIIVDENFTDSEKQRILLAAETWNEAGRALIGQNFFEVNTGTVNPRALPTQSGDCGAANPGPGAFYIISVTSNDYWSSLSRKLSTSAATDPFSESGVTFRCWEKHEPVRQVILMNKNVYPEKMTATVAIHELGHSLGLDHSCSGPSPDDQKKTSEYYRSCSGLPESHPYVQSVMYPETGINEKEVLAENDIARLTCLYGKK